MFYSIKLQENYHVQILAPLTAWGEKIIGENLILQFHYLFRFIVLQRKRKLLEHKAIMKGADMKYSPVVLAICVVLVSAVAPLAADLTPPVDGFIVVGESTVNGEFKGCNAQVGIKMANKLFVCTTFGFSPTVHYPKVTVYKNKKSEYKVFINGSEYMGYFFNGSERTDFP